MKEKEIWKPVKGFEAFYEVSNYGRVRTFLKHTINLKTGKFILLEEKLLKESVHKRGGIRYHLSRKSDNKHSQCLAHRLVAEHFIEKPNQGHLIVSHKDGNKRNNFYKNLEWKSYNARS